MELYRCSAAQLAKMLRSGECTATQILDSIYGRIDAVEGKVDAFVTLTREQAYAKAKEIDERFARGEEMHPHRHQGQHLHQWCTDYLFVQDAL